MALVLPGPAAADSYFSPAHPPGELDVRGGHLAWTVTDDRGRDHLRAGFAGSAHDLPIPTAGRFAGIDLGTDSRGHTVLVYARCPRLKPCDLYLYRPGDRREQRLGSVSRRACSETQPHIDRGVLLFGRKTRRAVSPRRRCSGGLFLKRPGMPLRRLSRRAPPAYDLADGWIAFERRIVGQPAPAGQHLDTEIRLLRIGHRRSRLAARGEGTSDRSGRQGTFVSGPRLAGGWLYWQRVVAGAREQDDVLRRRTGAGPAATLDRSGRAWVRPAPESDNLLSFAVDGPRLFYLFGGTGAPGFPIGRVEPAPLFR